MQSSLPLRLCRINPSGRDVNSPCKERRRLFSLLVSPVLHQLPPCDEALARFVKPKTWLLCSESWEEGDAAPSAASSLIWGVWLLHPAAQLLGLVWREGEYAYLGGLRQTCSKVAALILHRCTFWVCCSVFFLPLAPLSEQVKLQPSSAATPKLSFGGCRRGPCKGCWTLITFAPGMSRQ